MAHIPITCGDLRNWCACRDPQKTSFKLICRLRPGAADEIVPKSRLEAETLGLLNCAWLKILKASARKVSFVVSRPILKSFINDSFQLFRPGPRIIRGALLPYRSFGGATNMPPGPGST